MMRKEKELMDPPSLMTSREVCELLRISRKTLYNYCHVCRGRPPLLTRIQFRGRILFRRQLVEWVFNQREIGRF